jgi:ribosomal protein S21
MAVRIVVADKEPIVLALRRFNRSLQQHAVVWEMQRRGLYIQQNGLTFKATARHRAKKFKKGFKARKATLLAKMAGEQPTDLPAFWLKTAFGNRRRIRDAAPASILPVS